MIDARKQRNNMRKEEKKKRGGKEETRDPDSSWPVPFTIASTILSHVFIIQLSF
jgi:hypothetical protein